MSSSSSITPIISIPLWYAEFEQNLRNTYSNVKSYTGNLVLTGSSAIAYLLKELNMLSELNLMNDHPPIDFDFMYNNKDISHPNIIGLNKSTKELVPSITYKNQNTSKYNSFDLIYYPDRTPIKYITINNIDILCPKNLLDIYKEKVSGWYGGERNKEFDTKRLVLLEQIIKKYPNISTNCSIYTPSNNENNENNENNQNNGNINLNIPHNPFNDSIFDTPPSSPSSSKKQRLNNTPPRGGSYCDKYQKYKNKYIKLRDNLK